jgi:hypothetical protein
VPDQRAEGELIMREDESGIRSRPTSEGELIMRESGIRAESR